MRHVMFEYYESKLEYVNSPYVNYLSIQDIDAMDVKKLKTASEAVGTPLSYLLPEEVQLIETALGGIQMGVSASISGIRNTHKCLHACTILNKNKDIYFQNLTEVS